MPRRNHVSRQLTATGIEAPIVVVINSVTHTMSEPAFIAFMEQALNVLQAIVAQQKRTKGDA
jgi:hypothetical protein